MSSNGMSSFGRRGFLKLGAAGAAGALLGGAPSIARAASPSGASYDCVLQLFLTGAPSQRDLFDPKPSHAGNIYAPVDVDASAGRGDPQLTTLLGTLASTINGDSRLRLGLVRSLSHPVGDHSIAQTAMNCFWGIGESTVFPSMSAVMAHHLQASAALGIPAVVLGQTGDRANDAKGNAVATALFAQTGATAADNPTRDILARPVALTAERHDRRKGLARALNSLFAGGRPDDLVMRWDRAVEDAHAMSSLGLAAPHFDLTNEPLVGISSLHGIAGVPSTDLKTALDLTLAQRLIVGGVPYVHLGITGHDLHDDIEAGMDALYGRAGAAPKNLDRSIAQVCKTIADSGKRCLVVIGGEFGRTPDLTSTGGRDHFPTSFAWAFVSINQPAFRAGAYGATDGDGVITADWTDPAKVGAFIYRALGLWVVDRHMYDIPFAHTSEHASDGLAPAVDPDIVAAGSDPLLSFFGLPFSPPAFDRLHLQTPVIRGVPR